MVGLQNTFFTIYASEYAHCCVTQAVEMSGIGSNNLRKIPCDARHRLDPSALRDAIRRDREEGTETWLWLCIVRSLMYTCMHIYALV